ncbi:acetoin utilization protein AcuC [Roseovarius litoreus]|uniref:Acetoin utilization protein AcuC n=1 Tax=Roseovarius litoreus TaxID=1155722 RepID=A0A1M7C6V0_9RHOB|nr:acetoin utilization protein AcuC [Roseovarius litoreus]SHL62955.1 acetoin utilization protein AcuC [Roseovarius litoreus]
MNAPLFIGSEIYRGSSYGARHPLSIPRVPTVIDLSRAMGWLPPAQYRTSPRARPAALTAFHTTAYVAALQEAERTGRVSPAIRARHGLDTLSNPIFPEMFRRPATAAGGSLLATELLANGGAVYNPGGGTHHGMADRASGFCYLNDPVLALKALFAQGLTRIAYVDIDAHHSDGVEAAMSGTPGLLMISTHEENRWPFTGALHDTAQGTGFNLPLPRGSHDDDAAFALHELILPALCAHRPEAIVLQCGADAVLEDPLSRLAWSNNAHFDALRHIAPLSPRLLLLGGGGYNPWSVGRLWTGLWATLNGHAIPDHLPDPARDVLSALSWSRKGSTPRPAHWTTTIRDTPRPGPVHDAVRTGVRTLRARMAAHV